MAQILACDMSRLATAYQSHDGQLTARDPPVCAEVLSAATTSSC